MEYDIFKDVVIYDNRVLLVLIGRIVFVNEKYLFFTKRIEKKIKYLPEIGICMVMLYRTILRNLKIEGCLC